MRFCRFLFPINISLFCVCLTAACFLNYPTLSSPQDRFCNSILRGDSTASLIRVQEKGILTKRKLTSHVAAIKAASGDARPAAKCKSGASGILYVTRRCEYGNCVRIYARSSRFYVPCNRCPYVCYVVASLYSLTQGITESLGKLSGIRASWIHA